jgi:hypothetical protein
MITELGEIVTDRAESTVTLAVLDSAVTGTEALSVTLTYTLYTPTVEAV